MALIDVQTPYKELYQKGYLYVHQDGRKYIYLCNNGQTETVTSYARYLVSVHLGYIVPTHLEVDHINDNKTDDRIENFQILTKEQNRLKEYLRRMEDTLEHYILTCSHCGNYFIIPGRVYRYKTSMGRNNFYCSKTCSDRISNQSRIRISSELLGDIKKLRQEGGTSYSIAKDLGLSRNTVMKYW